MKYFVLFLFIFLLNNSLQIFLYLLNMSYVRRNNKIPEVFKDILREEDFKKSRLYTIDKMKLNAFETVIESCVMIFLIAFGFPIIERFVSKILSNEVFQGILFFFLVGAIYYLLGLSFQYYATFVLERKYEFNKTNLKLFVSDQAKGILIAVVLGFVILFTFLNIIRISNAWWIFVFLFAVFLVIFLEIISPLLLSLFNKLKPIENIGLKVKIEEIAKRSGLSISNIFVIDQSKRSLHTNAFFSGVGKSKRLILFDTLLKVHSEEEILAIFAHEVGHYIKRHVLKLIFINSLIFFVVIFSLFILVNSKVVNLAFGVNEFYSVALYATIFLGSIMSLLEFIYNSISRKFEYEADRVAADITSKQIIINALKRLVKSNLSNLYPHPLFVFFKYTHPTPLERINVISKINV
jgi:STE24 endopeptidase